MPAHQSADTIEESIRSVLGQTFEDFELLVVENASTDDTLLRAESIAARDPRVYVFHLERGSPVVGRNLGIDKARGEYVTFLDADDVYLPGFLAFVDEAVRAHPGRTLYAVGGVSVAPDGSRTSLSPTMPTGAPKDLTLADAAWMSLFPCMVAYPVDAIRGLAGFKDCHVEDYDLWIRTFAEGGTGIYVPAELSEHRIFRTSRSHDPAAYEASVDSALASLRDALGHDIADGDRRAVEERVALLEKRRERIHVRAGLEERLRAGEYRGARRAYVLAAPAYRHRGRYLAGLVLMLVSPRLFRRALLRHEGGD
jgi:hypothetical protein